MNSAPCFFPVQEKDNEIMWTYLSVAAYWIESCICLAYGGVAVVERCTKLTFPSLLFTFELENKQVISQLLTVPHTLAHPVLPPSLWLGLASAPDAADRRVRFVQVS